jgi:hypothetical protein
LPKVGTIGSSTPKTFTKISDGQNESVGLRSFLFSVYCLLSRNCLDYWRKQASTETARGLICTGVATLRTTQRFVCIICEWILVDSQNKQINDINNDINNLIDDVSQLQEDVTQNTDDIRTTDEQIKILKMI